MNRHDDVLQLVGETPVVRINRAVDRRSATLWAKLEYRNPGGSVKDRIALGMVLAAEKEGRIRPGRTTVIEATSGNTGIGLAMVCAVKGYRLILTMPEGLSEERRQLLKAYGAECVLTPAAAAMQGALEEARRIGRTVEDPFFPDQFSNPANPAAHRERTGPEIIRAFEDVGLDGFVTGIGTGGTITGVASALRARWPHVRIWGVEPAESQVLAGGPAGPHPVQGLGAGFIPEVLDQSCYDKVVPISGEHAFDAARALARAEGLLVGISTGAVFVAARKLARDLGPGCHVCFICASAGERYLSCGLFA